MPDFQHFYHQNITLIGDHTFIEGELKLKGVVRIGGHIQGNITIAPFGTLCIEKTGVVHGDIHCFNLEVHGKVHGQIYSEGSVIFQPSASFEGEVRANKLVVYPGAICNMQGQTLNAFVTSPTSKTEDGPLVEAPKQEIQL